jgi:hypothetical protein
MSPGRIFLSSRREWRISSLEVVLREEQLLSFTSADCIAAVLQVEQSPFVASTVSTTGVLQAEQILFSASAASFAVAFK